MIRKAFKMKLKPGTAQEYKRRHDALWPEIKQLLKAKGIYDYTIFLDAETDSLFAVHKIHNLSGLPDKENEEILWKWWASLEDIMETNPDSSPVIFNLDQVFHFD